MSIWDDEWEQYEKEEEEFHSWLDSLEGDGTDEEKYNKYQDAEYEKWLDANADAIAEQDFMNQAEYPEWMVKGQYYIMTVSNN